MKYRSISKKEDGFTKILVLLIAFGLGLYFLFNIERYIEKKMGYDFEGNCKVISEKSNVLSISRGDGFVIDAAALHAFYNTNQPMSFWFNGLVGESHLMEGVDYVVIDEDGRKRQLLTIDTARGISSKVIEGNGAFFRSEETRIARKMLECLQQPYFATSSGTAQ